MSKKVLLMFLLTLLTGCLADNKTRQASVIEHKPQIMVPAPAINTEKVDTNRLVEDTAARVRADMSANNSQLSGHIVAQLSKLELNLKALANIETKLDNNLYAQLRADLTSTISAVASFKAQLESTITLTNKMDANILNQMKALSDIQLKIGQMSGQADITASAQVGLKNELTKVQATLQTEIRNTAGRDVNMWPMSAVLTVIGIMLVMGGLIYGVTVFIGKSAYDNARAREEDYARLLAQAMGELEPHRARELMKQQQIPDS